MSRILRRPMFRGGPVDSRGTGITSGLADTSKPKRGLVDEPGGYAVYLCQAYPLVNLVGFLIHHLHLEDQLKLQEFQK